jgi:hypothetical protein
MTKIQKDVNYKTSEGYYLDTLEITSDFSFSKSEESLIRRGIRKHNTNAKLMSIIDVVKDKKRVKTYWKTYHCNHALLQNGTLLSGSLCRKRWCTHCCRIKTAEMTNAYKEPLLNLGNLYFVTLTRPNVKGRELKSEIKKLIKGFQAIKDNMRKTYGMKLEGMRKIEVTYNENTNTYHPHFHLIQSNLIHAEKLTELWLNYFGNSKSIAQNITAIDTRNENSFIELFKYATKETTKDGKQYSGIVLDTIYSSLEGIRIYQTYGSIKKQKQPIEEKIEKAEFSWLNPKQEIWVFEQRLKTWTNAYHHQLVNTLEYEYNRKQRHEQSETREAKIRQPDNHTYYIKANNSGQRNP